VLQLRSRQCREIVRKGHRIDGVDLDTQLKTATGRWRSILRAVLALAAPIAMLSSAYGQRLDGFNVIVTPDHSFGSAAAERALIAARGLGATTIAVIPFLWQASPSSPDIRSGSDMSDEALRVAIRQAHRLGFAVVVKPHIWVPESWAGAVEPNSEPSWKIWFTRYGAELERLARIAADEGAEALAIGTEFAKTTQRPEWNGLIATARAVFPRTLYYIAHNAEEAEAVPFWPQLDAIGVSLYPPLGADDDRAGRLKVMEEVAKRLDALSGRLGKPILVGEIGLRSAKGAAAKPWESAEERIAAADPQLQADVLADWLAVLNRPSIHGVLIWRWLTDPAAGGPEDTDFTVQGKPAEAVLSCAWKSVCARP
jgi:sugar phosphate isomerase/epimerase